MCARYPELVLPPLHSPPFRSSAKPLERRYVHRPRRLVSFRWWIRVECLLVSVMDIIVFEFERQKNASDVRSTMARAFERRDSRRRRVRAARVFVDFIIYLLVGMEAELTAEQILHELCWRLCSARRNKCVWCVCTHTRQCTIALSPGVYLL